MDFKRWSPIIVCLVLCWICGAPNPVAPLFPALFPSSTKRYDTGETWWIHDAHWFEALSMIIIGPIFMMFPGTLLELYGINQKDAIVANDVVPWFGALVALMGYHQMFEYDELSRSWVEACLWADFLWLYAFCTFISRHGNNGRGWNTWSVLGSLIWTLVFAPLRCYWLWGVSDPAYGIH
eukprot:TRINITY_DN12386_c0_g1_i1.p1 TRINITY_DN12386_c0_g1~~TRINITY_DN12386_c0_g1_i1.p1  ORF type:complete len:180 (+),score=20.02 TRINITY_DN12386_c0_g1_i1:2-541(+)